MDNLEYKEAIEDAVKYHFSIMPQEIKELITKARNNLHFGPTYYNKDGNERCSFDDDAIPFNFVEAVKKIAEYCDAISDIQEEYCDIGPVTDEEVYWTENIEGSAMDIKRGILGKELAQYC